MRALGFEPTQLCGTVYTRGGLAFSPDGRSLLSPAGSRVQRLGLADDSAHTLSFSCAADIAHLAISPDGHVLVAVDVTGKCVLANLRANGRPLARFDFKGSVTCVSFSPSGEFFAVGFGGGRHGVQVWRAPPLHKTFAPFVLFRAFTGHFGDVTCIDWSADSRFLVTGSADMTARVFSLKPPRGGEKGRKRRQQPPATTLSGHRDALVGCFFSERGDTCFTISNDGALYIWRLHDVEKSEVDPERRVKGGWHHTRRAQQLAQEKSSGRRWRLEGKHFFNQNNARVVSVACHRRTQGRDEVDIGGPSARAKHTAQSKSSSANTVLLVVGFDTGSFSLYDAGVDPIAALSARHAFERAAKKDGAATGTSNRGDSYCNELHTLSISKQRVTASAINATGQWLAFGCSALGQLLVWEWESETYVLKQQGHVSGGASGLTCSRYSRDGQWIGTGGDDGSVKVWNSRNGFSLVTFREHRSVVTDLAFGGLRAATLYSSSKDGTVRAFDLRRYRNFRTFSPARPCELLCVAIDASGELVVAGGGADSDFGVYVWSVLTGRLLDSLRAHEGPVSHASFHPHAPTLATSSWDGTVRVWDVFEGRPKSEPFRHSLAAPTKGKQGVAAASIEPVMCVAWSPNGEIVCSAGHDGQLLFWDVDEGNVALTIDARKDIVGGRAEGDAKSVESQLRSSNEGSKFYVDSVVYSPDGTCILATGNSKFVCCYYIPQRLLVRRWSVSTNRSLGGVTDLLNSRAMTEAGVTLNEINDDPDSGAFGMPATVGGDIVANALSRTSGRSRGRTGAEDDSEYAMPGASQKKYQMADKRRVAQTIRCFGCDFAPSARSFCVATTEGLLLFSLDNNSVFDPFNLDAESTPDNCKQAADDGNSLRALIMAFRLNDDELLEYCLSKTHADDSVLICQELPDVYVAPMLRFLSRWVERTPRMEFAVQLCRQLLFAKGQYVMDTVGHSGQQSLQLLPVLRQLYRSLNHVFEDTAPAFTDALHTLEYLERTATRRATIDSAMLDSLGDTSATTAWEHYAAAQRASQKNVLEQSVSSIEAGRFAGPRAAVVGNLTDGSLPGWGDFDDEWNAGSEQALDNNADPTVKAVLPAPASSLSVAPKKKRKRSRAQVPSNF